ncbi:MAG TPA: M67 family metallopeptidase [Dehalococcoidia bacterium]|nr:M67 family metallopeptidase [Dehalococcoidia bacterium]
MTLRLPQAMIDEMVAQAREELPNECCGIISGRDGEATKLYRTRNSEASPFRYNIHPLDLLKIEREADENGWGVMVIYHSHVASEAYPSPTDVHLAHWPGTDPPEDLYPGVYYALVSLKYDPPQVRAYTIHASVVDEVPIEGV